MGNGKRASTLEALATALVSFYRAFEEVDEIVTGCATFGVVLIRPRRMLSYRRRLEGFIEQAELGSIGPGAVLELYEAIESIEDPELLLQDLMMGGVMGKALIKFRAWQTSYDQLVQASTKAFEEIPE